MMQTPIAHFKASILTYNFDSGCFTSLKRTQNGPTYSYILTILQNQVHNFSEAGYLNREETSNELNSDLRTKL